MIRFQPYNKMLFAFDRQTPETLPRRSVDAGVDIVAGGGPPDDPRAPARQALDVGTGSGFLASLLSPSCERVHAIDVNPRGDSLREFSARWNGFTNITFHAGDLFAPVRNERFDLIVSNPPFMIAPVTSAFSNRYRFKHSGLEGDTFCLNLARGASQLLIEGGYFHMMFQWEELADIPWSAMLEKSLAGLGCDVWVARLTSESAAEHVAAWVAGLSDEEQASAETLAEQAHAYFQNKNVASVGSGLLTMRRASQRENYLWFDEAPDDRSEPYGASVAALMDARVRLSHIDDNALLKEIVRASPDLNLLQTSSVRDAQWAVSNSELLLTRGLKYSFGDVHPDIVEMLPHLDGRHTLAELLARLSSGGKGALPPADPKRMSDLRELLWYGFLYLEPSGVK